MNDWRKELSELQKHLPQPNESQTWFELGMECERYLMWHGVFLLWKVPDGNGGVYAVHCIDPAHAIPHSATLNFPNGYYRIVGELLPPSTQRAEGVAVKAEDTIRGRREYKG